MKINRSVFEKVKKHNAQILCVTKYWDVGVTKEILDFGLSVYPEIFVGVGENRTQQLQLKQLPRESVHFIGNVQSRQLKEIVRYSSVIHSVSKFTHLTKLDALVRLEHLPLQVYLQINVSTESQKGGILPIEFPAFVESLSMIENPGLTVSGISAIGSGDFSVGDKIKEFKRLKELRDSYLPGTKISAGTSRDYEIALGEGIDIVRVGNALIESD